MAPRRGCASQSKSVRHRCASQSKTVRHPERAKDHHLLVFHRRAPSTKRSTASSTLRRGTHKRLEILRKLRMTELGWLAVARGGAASGFNNHSLKPARWPRVDPERAGARDIRALEDVVRLHPSLRLHRRRPPRAVLLKLGGWRGLVALYSPGAIPPAHDLRRTRRLRPCAAGCFHSGARPRSDVATHEPAHACRIGAIRPACAGRGETTRRAAHRHISGE